ncbi:MAG TPA: hypothetical protein VNK95_02465 [Caldilineaceae bacterium]|nr:hypothetical protein [Caldilineaceae bacterium]
MIGAKSFHSLRKIQRPQPFQTVHFWLPALLIAAACILATSQARAHGGTGLYIIRGVAAGPYLVHVWAAPGVPRTGEIHIDTALFERSGQPALAPLVHVTLTRQDGDATPLTALAGPPDPQYPYPRSAAFWLDTPGVYHVQVAIADAAGPAGAVTAGVRVQQVAWWVKAAIIVLWLLSAGCGLWLLVQTRAFWRSRGAGRAGSVRLPGRKQAIKPDGDTEMLVHESQIGGEQPLIEELSTGAVERRSGWLAWLNGPVHARALWLFMLVVVAHWLEHVLQIYQIYGLGWSPDIAGGLLGVLYPQLIESEVLHFVYDFIQWAGILLLRPGFRGRARTFWTVATVAQSWHYFEHVLLMGQYLTGYYLFGAPQQISLLQLWFPRPELHFFYNLIVFVPMVIAVHKYLQPRRAQAGAMPMAPAYLPDEPGVG